MKDKPNKPNHTTFPIPVPSPDAGWADMRKRLENEMPRSAAIPAVTTAANDRSKKLLPLLLLLLFFISTGIGIAILKNNANSKTPVAVDSKQKTGDTEKKLKQPVAANKKTGTTTGSLSNVTGHEPEAEDETSHDPTGERLATSTSVDTHNRSNSLNADGSVKQTRQRYPGSKKQQTATAKKKPKAGKKNDELVTSFAEKSTPGNSSTTGDNKETSKESPNDPVKETNVKNEKKKDSSVAMNIPPPTPEENGWKLKGGLFWSFQLPTAAASDYFTGTNARSQPYRFILPGAWLQAQSDRHLLMFELNPFATNLVPSKPFRTESSIESIPDTNIVTQATKTLRKQFGISATLGYANNVAGKWWLGGNLQSFWWSSAVAVANGEIRKYPVNGSPFVSSPLNEKYRLEDDEWSYFLKMQFYLNAEANYISTKWQASFRTGLALTPVSKQAGPANPFRMELQYRLQLFDKRKDKEKKQAGNWSH